MISINHEKKAIYFRIPKCASTYLSQTLKKNYNFIATVWFRPDHKNTLNEEDLIKFNNNDHMFNLENYNPTIENIPYFFSIEENAGKTENSGDMLYEDIIGVYPSNLINHIHDYRDAVNHIHNEIKEESKVQVYHYIHDNAGDRNPVLTFCGMYGIEYYKYRNLNLFDYNYF